MGKRLVDIDESWLEAAQAELGTVTIRATVNEALRLAGAPRNEGVRHALAILGNMPIARSQRRVAITHLADTSVLTRLSSSSVRGILEPLVRVGVVGRAGISDLEIGFSARSADEWDELAAALEVMALIPIGAEHFVRARQVQRLLAANGLRGRKIRIY